jgi:NAD(P)H-dependent FMN reductase
MDSTHLQVIVGSTRPTRAADHVVRWVMDRAGRHGAFRAELIDLRDWPLPMFGEHYGTIGDFRDPTYSDPVVRRWNAKIKEGDAYLVITPEYNHSIPGVLKNAIDSVFVSFAFRNKPMATVSYSGGTTAGAHAAAHLTQIAVETEAVPLRSGVSVPGVETAFGPGGDPADGLADVKLGVVLDDLAWWASALREARAGGELTPGVLRVRAAMTAA